MKRKSAKELGIPEKFRLTTNNIEKCVEVIIRKKMGHRIEVLYREEMELVNCANEAFTNLKAECAIFRAVGEYGEGNLRKEIFKEQSSLRVWFTNEEGRRDNYTLGPKYYAGGSTAATAVLINMPSYIMTSAENWDNFYVRLPWWFDGCIEQYLLEPSYLPGSSWVARYKSLVAGAKRLYTDVGLLRAKAESALRGCKSVIQLVESAPEFLEIIKEAAGMDDKTACSDIPEADKLQELRKAIF